MSVQESSVLKTLNLNLVLHTNKWQYNISHSTTI